MPFQFRKEAIEEDLNSNFPSQGQGNPPLYYSLSEVVVPTYSINAVTEGSGLAEILQTAWDFSTGSAFVANTTSTLISNPGFWRVSVRATADSDSNPVVQPATIQLDDGIGTKVVWSMPNKLGGVSDNVTAAAVEFVVFCNTGISLTCTANNNVGVGVSWRQIATLNGTLVNPLGYSAA